MKVYIDRAEMKLLKVEKESPFYTGDILSSNITVYFNAAVLDASVTLSFLLSNGRTPRNNLVSNENGTVTIDSATWYYYTWNLNTANGVLTSPGQIQMTLSIRSVNKLEQVNFTNTVVRTALFGNDENILILGDNPDEVVDDLAANITNLDIKVNEKLDRRVGSLVVDELPEEGENETIYYVKQMVNNDTSYDCYVWNVTLGTWVFLGTSSKGLYTDAEAKEFQESIEERLDAQDEQIQNLGQLQPSGTATSSVILAKTSADGIWVGTDTGYWYYWNGTQYVSGGAYQTDLSYENLNEITTRLLTFNNTKNVIFVLGQLNLWNGSTQTSDTRYMTDFIDVSNQKIELDVALNGNTQVGLCYYDESKTFVGYLNWAFAYLEKSNAKYVKLAIRNYDGTLPNSTDVTVTISNKLTDNVVELNNFISVLNNIDSDEYNIATYKRGFLDLTAGNFNHNSDTPYDNRISTRYYSLPIKSFLVKCDITFPNTVKLAIVKYNADMSFNSYIDWFTTSSYIFNVDNCAYFRIAVRGNPNEELPDVSILSNIKYKFLNDIDTNIVDTYKNTILNEKEKNSLTLGIITDTHYSSTTALKVLNMYNNMIEVSKYGCWDMAINLGDVHDETGKTIATIKSELSMLSKLFNNIEAFNTQLKGNHDTGTWASDKSTTNLITDAVWANLCMNEFGKYKGFVIDENNTTCNYFYKDFERQKIRVIALDSLDIPLVVDGVIKYGQTVYGMQEKQLQWLANTALILPSNEWAVVFISHVPTVSSGGDGQGFKNYSVFSDIVTAFRNGTSGTSTSTTTDFEASVTYNFVSQGEGEVICEFHGHTHSDGNTSDSIVNKLIGFVNSANANASFDTACIDRTSKVIKTIRYEIVGYDRTINY